MNREWDMEQVVHAVGALNSMALPPFLVDGLQVHVHHWGVTPPAYWRSGRHPNPCVIHKHPNFEICHA